MNLTTHKLTLNIAAADLPADQAPAFLKKLEAFLNEAGVVASGRIDLDCDPLTGETAGGYMILNNTADTERKTGRQR